MKHECQVCPGDPNCDDKDCPYLKESQMIDPKDWRCAACGNLMSEACESCKKAQLTPVVNGPLLEASAACSGMADYLEKMGYTEPNHFTGHDPHSAYARLDRLERATIELLRAQALLLRFLSGDQDA